MLGYICGVISFLLTIHGSPVWQFNSLRPRQNGRLFADDTFKRIFLNENVRISIKTSLKFVPKGPISNIPALVQIMAWRRPGDKLLSEPMIVSLSTHKYVTRPQWVNLFSCWINSLHAKFCIYLHFMSLLHIDITQVLKIPPQVRPWPTYST